MKYQSTRYAGHEFLFERVNVILGANGSGKSKLLKEIRDKAGASGDRKVVYIEGGRTIEIMDVLKFDMRNFSQYDGFDKALNHYENKRITSLASRVFDALIVLDKRDAQLKAKHSDLVDKWLATGGEGPCPKRAQPPLDHLFELFNEIFPQITLSYASDSRRLSVVKGNNRYGPSELSDGEKQVFSILADLLELASEHKIIIADEPELNLHPELAERLWTLLENEFPDKIFIYATHSINFALRKIVDKVWVLSSDAANITEFIGLDALPRAETTALLGSLPGILSSNRVVVTEGHEKSFDALFYRWVLNDDMIEILPAGGCSDVVSIVSKSGIWEKVASNIAFVGVVDSDYRDNSYLHSLGSVSIHALPFHEAEAYLCAPEVIVAVASRIGSQENPLTADQVTSAIMSTLESQKLIIAARRVFASSRITLGLSVEKRLMSAASDRDNLLRQMKIAAEAEVDKAQQKLGPDAVEQAMDTQILEIESVISDRDIQRALRLLPAKELLNQLAPRAGCRNAADLMRSLRHNFDPSDFSPISDLSASLTRGLQAGAKCG